MIAGSILASHHRNYVKSTIIRVGKNVNRLLHKPHNPTATINEVDNVFFAWDALWGGRWHLLALGSLINVLFDMFTLYLLFIAAGNNISFGMLLSGYALPILLGRMAFVLPGGVGVVETGMVALYASLGISNTTAVVVVGAYRLISFWLPSVAGFPIAAFLQRSQRQ